MPEAEILAPLGLELGEGARAIDGDLFFVDLLAGILYRRMAGVPTPVVRSARPIGAAAAVAGSGTRLVLAEGLGVTIVELAETEQTSEPFVEFGPPSAAATHRVNDAAVDPTGALWVGTMPLGDGAPGAVYRVTPDRRVVTVLDGIACPNGPAFAADGTVYLADTLARVVLRSRITPDGALAEFEPFVEIDGGLPDGMSVDAAGDLRVAVWGTGEVRRYDPDGGLADVIRLGARQPTSVCLIEVDGTPSLVVTSARRGLTDPTEGDGAVWAVPCSATPLPTPEFGAATLTAGPL